MKNRIDINAPVILSLTFISLIVLLLNMVLGGAINQLLAVRYTSWIDPMMYIRMFVHVIAHQDLAHYTGNFLLILAVGPMVEEKYGTKNMVMMLLTTAFVTGLINVIFFRHIALIGASGLVFLLILLASFTNIREGKIPLTVLLVGVVYLGNEVINGLLSSDNISQFSHILGGLCGAGFGWLFYGEKMKGKSRSII